MFFSSLLNEIIQQIVPECSQANCIFCKRVLARIPLFFSCPSLPISHLPAWTSLASPLEVQQQEPTSHAIAGERMSIDSLLALLVYLCIPWIVVELASQLLRHLSNRGGSAILGRRRRLTTTAIARERDGDRFHLTRGSLWFKVETTALNSLPDRFLKQLDHLWQRTGKQVVPLHHHPSLNGSGTHHHEDLQQFRRGQGGASRYLELFYDCGTLFAGLACVGSILFLIWGTFDLIGQISQLGYHDTTEKKPLLLKRQLRGGTDGSQSEQSWSLSLVPLVCATRKGGDDYHADSVIIAHRRRYLD